MRFKVSLFLFMVFSCFLVSFSSEHPGFQELKFSSLSTLEGLAHNNVECIIKDTEGFIWIGTRNGLCRFDGYEIKTFTHSPADSNTLSGNRILSIAEDKSGFLWIGTYNNGLNRLNKTTNTITRFPHLQHGNNITKIKVFGDSSIWFCTNYGLTQYIPAADTFIHRNMQSNNSSGLNSNNLYDILETRNGEIYVGTEHQTIQQFDKTSGVFKNIPYKRDPRLNIDYKKTLIEDNNGIIWITANVHGLCSYNPENGESEIYTEFNSDLTTNILMGSMDLDESGNIWLSTDDEGIMVFNPQTKEFYNIKKTDSENSITSNHVYTLYFDNQNFLWVGTFDEGVCYYDPDRYKFAPSLYKPNDLTILSGKSVTSIFQDSEERIWVGTDGDGLYRINADGSIIEYHHNTSNINTLSTEVITSINEDHLGNILLGTYAAGFMILDPKTNLITRIYQGEIALEQLASSSIWNIFRDSDDRIWLGCLGTGLDLYDPDEGTFTNYGPQAQRDEKIDFPNVMAIMEIDDGDLWFGTEGQGIYILDRQTQKFLQLPPDSTQTITTQGLIKCFYQDKWGNVWIGTEGNGLFTYYQKSKEFREYTIDDGLSSNIVESIIEDAHGSIWLGTSNGLSVYDPNTEKFRTYLMDEGLSGNKFNQNAMIKLSDGRIISGTSNGLDVFEPEKIITNPILPKIVFTTFKILNQEVHVNQMINDRIILSSDVNYCKEIVLSNRDKSFSLAFAALNYTLPNKCQYAYKMEGFDDNWIYTSSKIRSATYTNLPAGSYTFYVKSSNNDGKWGNNLRKISIKILPPFYETWWFKTLVIFLVVLIIFLGYRYRLNSVRNTFLKQQFEQEKKIIKLEKDKLDNELQKLTFHILNRNRELIDQKNRLLGLSMKAKESVRIGLQNIISKLDEELSDDRDWKYIEPQLDKVYNNFVSRLKEKHPDLNLSEIKIAAYVRMNLSTKEISEFMHKTTRAIENDRYRLRKKIGLDTNDSLKAYLNAL